MNAHWHQSLSQRQKRLLAMCIGLAAVFVVGLFVSAALFFSNGGPFWGMFLIALVLPSIVSATVIESFGRRPSLTVLAAAVIPAIYVLVFAAVENFDYVWTELSSSSPRYMIGRMVGWFIFSQIGQAISLPALSIYYGVSHLVLRRWGALPRRRETAAKVEALAEIF